MKNNFVAKNLYKTNKPSVEPDKKRLKQSDATLREISEVVLECRFDSETITFESGSAIYWDESEDSLQGSLNDIGCSSIEIDCEGD
ncbi:hypothetical protein [Pseudomonas phage vB_PsaM_M1]|nr:hypothetical protein [Pseudomonas phage vB_PsaM_M1]